MVGLGSRLIDSDPHLLDLSVGVGYRSIEENDGGDDGNGGILTSDLVYEYRISESARITQVALVELGDDNNYFESETALISQISGALSSKISYLVKHNSEVPDDTEKTDELVSISLVYAF